MNRFIKMAGILATLGLLAACARTGSVPGGAPTSSDIRYVGVGEAAGLSLATVAEGDLPLAHTGQLMALNRQGRLVGEGDAAQQTARVLQNIDRALSAVGAGREDLLKLNVYVASNAAAEAVRQHLAEAFSGEAKPAVSYVVTSLPRSGALVAIDAVAVAPERYDERSVEHVAALGGDEARGHVAVMPPGGKVYVSGQVAEGPDLIDATRGTMESLHATLAYLGLSADDVIQVKGFLPDAAQAGEVESVIAEYYRRKPAPPIVSVEWQGASYLSYLSVDTEGATPIEIELIASLDEGGESVLDGERLQYLTPPDLTAPTTYSRVVIAEGGPLFFTSGLYGDPSKEAEGQLQDIYQAMDELLPQVGSDFDHLLKGTYYVTNREASEALNAIREVYYDPQRAPASAKMPVRATGRSGAVATLDMIGLVPN